MFRSINTETQQDYPPGHLSWIMVIDTYNLKVALKALKYPTIESKATSLSDSDISQPPRSLQRLSHDEPRVAG